MPTEFTQEEIEVNGHCIHYYRTLNGAVAGKLPLVLVHGFSDNGLCWEPVANELKASYDILMPDMHGHGLSARVEPGEALDMSADVAALIRAVGLVRPIVGGHSMGAGITAQLGARFPELVRALILEDPAWFLPRPGATPQPPRGLGEDSPMGVWIKSVKSQTEEQALAQCRSEHPIWPEIIIQRWYEGKKQLDINFLNAKNTMAGDWQETARTIACPTLLVTSDPELGGLVTPEIVRMVTEMNPNIREAHIPGVGHHIRFANQTAYMQAVRAFLSEI